MTEEVIELTKELRSVRISLGAVLTRLDTLDRMAKKERRRSMWHRLGSGLVFIVVVVVVVLGYREYQEQARLERRRCETVNETRTNTRHAIVQSVHELGRNSSNPERVLELADRLDRRLAEILPLENCKDIR